MSQRNYSASLSQSQGRLGYSVIFRHPTRRDDSTGNPGLRVRRGLGTRDKAEAEELREQLNTLLADPRFHNSASRVEAERRFDERVVDIFFDKMYPKEFDFSALRDEAIPLPPQDPDGYRHVLLLGTTGAGKTTLVRQLIGTSPSEERFPSTSTAKTTIHDTEIVLDDGPWRAVVTFVSSSETREYLNECISAAVLEAAKGANEDTVLRRLLEHVNQRFRFNYVLGNGPETSASISDFDDDEAIEEDAGLSTNDEFGAIDLAVTNELLSRAVKQLRELAQRLGKQLQTELDASGEEDKRVVEEIFEEELDTLLAHDESFHEIADALMDEIEKRFDLLPPGSVTKTRQGWPLAWKGEWPNEKRSEFLKSILRFSSNYASLYGRLLTPLVNGVRVSGPFSPTWVSGRVPKLVLFDGEGLGHTPKSASSLSTGVSQRIQEVDAVLLVDNATQPMQAAPFAAMRHIVTTGNVNKLILAFTHFDEVKGDNLPNASQKARHVLASAENVLTAFGQDISPNGERFLRKRIERARFFLANLQEPLKESTASGKQTISQLRKLLVAIDQVVERPQPAKATPCYDSINLPLAIHSAAKSFHETWRSKLGLEVNPEVGREHWSRIKALNRRLATMNRNEYDSLKPVADLLTELTERIYTFIQNPVNWEGSVPSDEECQSMYDAFARCLTQRINRLSTRRVWQECSNDWERAYYLSGPGSTFERADVIGNNIYQRAAPIPNVTPSPDRNQFLREVVEEVRAAAKEVGAQLI